ncbi:hypothetical protein BH23ACT10_BH23ACT10_22920 [soil metagenome]
MVNFVKKVRKRAAADLNDDEEVLDARVVMPAGHAMRQAAVAGVNQHLNALARNRMERHQRNWEAGQRHAVEDTAGMAVDFPPGSASSRSPTNGSWSIPSAP